MEKILKIQHTFIHSSNFLQQITHNLYQHSLIHYFHSSINPQKQPKNDFELFSTTQIATPTKIQKLISSQSDPLLAKEIFDLASKQPNFQHSYSTYHTLILKLANAHQFSLMERYLLHLKRLNYKASPGLFSKLICIFGDAHMPERALKLFYNVIEYNCTPTSKHLNLVLGVLVAERGLIRPAFDLFRVANKYGVSKDVRSYNIMMRAFCGCNKLSIAYKVFDEMLKRDVMPNVESYRILMQGLCRKSQVSKAMDLLDDMLNKGFVPDSMSYTSLLNSLCRKKKLKEAYKLLCRMKVKGCNPNVVHYNTVMLGLCREGRAHEAIKVLDDMYSNGCLPNLVSYRTLVGGLVHVGFYDEAKKYMEEMISKGLSPHFSITHGLVQGLCNVGRVDDACGVLGEVLKFGEAPYVGTWQEVVPRICEVEEMERLDRSLNEVIKVDIKPHTRIVEVGAALEEYLIRKIQANSWKK